MYKFQLHGPGLCTKECGPKCKWLHKGYMYRKGERYEVFYWNASAKKRSNRSIVAISEWGRIAGVFKYSMWGGTLKSFGTYVSPSHRQNGLAVDLWKKALRTDKPGRVKVDVVTDKGMTLIQSLKRRYRAIEWVIKEGGSRKLRELKK